MLSKQTLDTNTDVFYPILSIKYPFTSLLQVELPSSSFSGDNYNFNLSLTDLPFTEFIFKPNTTALTSGQSITVVLLIPFSGYANSFTLYYSPSSDFDELTAINIPIDQIYTSWNSSSSPDIIQNFYKQQLFQTVTIFYNPIVPSFPSPSTNPLYNSASYSVTVDFSQISNGSNLFIANESEYSQ